MNKAVKDLLVTTLRSGKYKQGVGYLNKNNKFCCMGVLCELAAMQGICKRDKPWKTLDYITYQGNGKVLPGSVMTWAGLKTSTGQFAKFDDIGLHSLSGLNDNGWSFERIADKIEEVWEKL